MFNLINLNNIFTDMGDWSTDEWTLFISVVVLIVIVVALLLYLFFAKDSKKKSQEVEASQLSNNDEVEIYELKNGEIETSIVDVNKLVAKEYTDEELEYKEYDSLEELIPEYTDESSVEEILTNEDVASENESYQVEVIREDEIDKEITSPVVEEENNKEELTETTMILNEAVDNYYDELRDEEETSEDLIREDNKNKETNVKRESESTKDDDEIRFDFEDTIDSLSEDDEKLFNDLLRNI